MKCLFVTLTMSVINTKYTIFMPANFVYSSNNSI